MRHSEQPAEQQCLALIPTLYFAAESRKQQLIQARKHQHKLQLDDHLKLQEKEYQRRQRLELKYAEEQQQQLQLWRDQEVAKAELRRAKNAEERENLDRMLKLKQAREQMEKQRDEDLDAKLLAKAQKDLEDEQSEPSYT